MAYSDVTNLIRFVRIDIGDDSSTQTFTDAQIVSMITKGAKRLDARLGACLDATSGGFIDFYQAFSGSTPLASGDFTLPSGASGNGLPNPLFNLLMLQIECMFAKRINFDSAGKAIRVRDGDTEIDTSVGAGGLGALVTSQGGPCQEFENALKDYCEVFGDDIVALYGDIIWRGNVRKAQSHSQAGVDGIVKIEQFPDMTDFLDGNDDPRDPQVDK